jgi:hypothetical protein
MAITGISAIGNQQIIAAGAQSATKAYQDSNGGVITSKYQTTANMSNYQTIAGMSEYATTASVTGKQDTLTFGYTDNQISQINGSAIYSQGGGGGGYTGNVQQALDEVYGSSATWNTVTNKLDAASQVVTATGGTTTYVQTINGKNISATNAGSALSATNAYNLTNTAIKVASATSASTAYYLTNTAIKVASATSATNANTATYASNGVSLTDIYNSARSGYAASAYIRDKYIVNGRHSAYDSQNNPNWWTGNNIFGLKLNSASVFNSTGISIGEARVDGIELGSSGSNFWMLNVSFLFNKFIPINTASWNVVTTSFITTTGHFVAPVYSEIWTEWGAAFGAMMTTDAWASAIKLNKFDPWTGYTGDKVYVNYSIPWVSH